MADSETKYVCLTELYIMKLLVCSFLKLDIQSIKPDWERGIPGSDVPLLEHLFWMICQDRVNVRRANLTSTDHDVSVKSTSDPAATREFEKNTFQVKNNSVRIELMLAFRINMASTARAWSQLLDKTRLTISIAVMPNDQMSDLESYVFFGSWSHAITSGAIQYGVPMKVLRLPMVLSSWALTPKSTSFTSAFEVRSTFCPFISRWITLALCKWAKPRRTPFEM